MTLFDTIGFLLGVGTGILSQQIISTRSSPFRLMILIISIALVLVPLVIICLWTFSSPPFGSDLYVIYRLLFNKYLVSTLCGVGFGIIFLPWLQSLRFPRVLPHGIKHPFPLFGGCALLILFVSGMFMNIITGSLQSVTDITTPAFSVSFIQDKDRYRGTPYASPDNTQSSEKNHAFSSVYIRHASGFADRDRKYVSLIHGEAPEKSSDLHEVSTKIMGEMQKCFKRIREPDLMHVSDSYSAPFYKELVKIVLYSGEMRATGSPGKGLLYKFIELWKRHCTSLDSHFEEGIGNVSLQALPYATLFAAHLLDIAGYGREATEIIAYWIDESREIGRNIHGMPWYQVRALLHLQTILSEDDNRRRYAEILNITTRKLNDILNDVKDPQLGNLDIWLEKCGTIVGDNKDQKYIDRIYFTAMTQRALFVQAFLDIIDDNPESSMWLSFAKGLEEADTLWRYAEENVSVSRRCYEATAGKGRDLLYRAGFYAVRGKLIVTLADRVSRKLPGVGIDREAYLRGYKDVSEALSILRQFARDEQADARAVGITKALRRGSVSDNVDELEHYARRLERALGMRRHGR